MWIGRVFRLMSINWVMCMIGVRIALWEPIRCYSSIHWCVNWIVVSAWVVRRVTRRLSTAIQLLKVPGCEFGILHSIKTSLSIVVWNSMSSIRMWCTWFLLCLMHRKVPCVIGKDDQMYYVKQEVGKTSKLTVTISACRLRWWCIECKKPVEYGGMHEGGECVWEYEIEGFWSTRIIEWVCMMNSCDHDLQYSDWCCFDSGDRFVHIRKQASCWEENEPVEPFPRWGWCEDSCCLIVARVILSLFTNSKQS